MSTASRLISGSAASWVQIGVNMVFQVILLPIYLTHWDVVTYGVWISIQALVSIITTLDFGHQEFLTYEFLRIGKEKPLELSVCLWSGISISTLISILQIVSVLFFINSGTLPLLLGKSTLLSSSLIHEAGLILLLQSITWFICLSVSGSIFRVLGPFGYYPRMAWWNLFSSIVSSIAPIVAINLGADLLVTGITTACASVVFSIPLYIDLFRLLRREKIKFCYPSWKVGSKNFLHSLAISGKGLLENARQQGVRLVLVPLVGAAGLVAFSTMRTGANVALQGVRTIINPLMPELMRFLSKRDQERVDASFGILWIVVVAIVAPALVVLQAFIEPLYHLWTRGQTTFDPLLFSILSLSILVYAVAQPAMAVVIGNNLLKPQLMLSIAAAAIVIGGMLILVPKNGILGAGISLLVAEIVATSGYKIVAQRWLREVGLLWPAHSSQVATTSVWIAAIAMAFMIWLPQIKWSILICSTLLLLWNAWRFWQVLPSFATQYAKKMLIYLPGIKKIYNT
ncbi:lipopolysaccharide biosynthesis protein [Spirosoma flavum]|uniref:Lipopolysaccharide biosynthesis protein n=1 Tax=Spirosoma flavum TaxID=2048557 RepID=A0ABW6AFM1_9BACT